jgi:shikimate kinase
LVDELEPEGDDFRAPKNTQAPTNLLLLGMTGSGKSVIGWQLAQKLGFGFLDLDAWIEKAKGKAISEIFASEGEKAFRDFESSALTQLAGIRNHVISLGSGTVMRDENWEQIKSLGTTVFIDCTIEELVRRLKGNRTELEKRPLLHELVDESDTVAAAEKLKERLSAMFAQRKARFALADLSYPEGFSTPEESARGIKALFEASQKRSRRDSQRSQNGRTH